MISAGKANSIFYGAPLLYYLGCYHRDDTDFHQKKFTWILKEIPGMVSTGRLNLSNAIRRTKRITAKRVTTFDTERVYSYVRYRGVHCEVVRIQTRTGQTLL